jgi:hypothetical protein
MFRIGDYLIDPNVLQLVPESVARESGVLPIRFVDGRLHFLLADRRNLYDVLQKLNFILNKDLVHEIGDPSTVHALVDTAYSMQGAQVTRCSQLFAVICSRQWLELDETDDPDERHCPGCNETVYHCETEAEALDHAERGHCVALHDSSAEVESVTSGLMYFPEIDPESPEGRKEADPSATRRRSHRS